MVPNPEISVIVCHHKGTFIYKFVESCKNQIVHPNEPFNCEIIVVTSDDALALKGIPGCIVINGPQLPAAKRNMGARIAKGKYLAFFDDDVEIYSDCLRNFHQCLDTNPQVGMVFGKLFNMEFKNRFDEAGGFLTWTGFIWSRAGQNDIDKGQFDRREYIFAGKSASCIINRWIFERIGGFDEDFGILGEESDLAWRVWLYGYKVMFDYRARGEHAFNTIFKPAKDYYNSERVHLFGCRNYTTMLIKNLGTVRLMMILPIHILAWITAGLAMIGTLRIHQGVNIFRGLIQLMKRLPSTVKKRKEIQSKRVISDRELFKFIRKDPPAEYYFQRFWRYTSLGLHG